MGRGRQWPGAVQLLSRTRCPGAGTRSTIHHCCCCCCCHSTGREKPPVSVAGAHQPSPAHATVAGPIKLDRQMFCHQSQRTGWAGLSSAGILPHISSKHLISPAQTADCTTACTLVLRTRLLLNNAVPSPYLDLQIMLHCSRIPNSTNTQSECRLPPSLSPPSSPPHAPTVFSSDNHIIL